jgi:serine protease Do
MKKQWTIALPIMTALAYSVPCFSVEKAGVQSKVATQDTSCQNGINYAKQLSHAFTQVAKKAIPAVAFIKVETLDSSPYLRPGNDIEDFFSDDFFQRFFQGPQSPKRNPKNRVRTGEGSGFLITSDGYIVTNYHVVKDASKITVDLNDPQKKDLEAQLVGGDPQTDIAILKIQGENLPYLNLGDSNAIDICEWVIAVGSPFGLEASVTVGVVSQKSRNNLKIADLEDFIQTDAAINPGNSGGPLLDLDGNVIGMNTAIVSRSGGYMGIGFAIPSVIIRSVSDQLINQGEVSRGYLGVELQAIDQDMSEALKMEKPQGILVTQVAKNSAAEKAGLKVGDVILELNKNPVKSLETFRNDISLMSPNTPINLKVNRDGKIINIPVTIGSRDRPAPVMSSTAQKLGLQVESLTSDLATQNGYKSDETGVIIRQVQPGSLAQRVGLQKGMVIIAVNRQKVVSVDEFNQAIEKSDGKHVLLLVNDKVRMRFFSIRLN